MARLRSLLPTLLIVPLVPLLAQASPDSPVEALAQTRVQKALATQRSPRGAAALLRLHELKDELPDLGLLARTDAQIAENEKADPLVRALARQLDLQIQLAEGHDSAVAQRSRQLGDLRDFYLAGSFDNDGKAGCDTDFGPEKSLDLAAKYASKGRELTWHKLAERPRDGYVDLAEVLRPNHDAVGYALTFLEASRASTVTLDLGTSGGFRLWVNGQLAAKSDRYNIPRPDQARVAVSLRKGLNKVLLKVCQDQGPFGFFLREEPNAQGALLAQPTLPSTLPVPGPAETPMKFKQLPTLADAIAKLAKAHPKDAGLLMDQAEILSQLRTFDEKDHLDADLAEKAARLLPDDVDAQLLAARLEQRDQNVRRGYLEAALKLSPADPRALTLLGEHELSEDHEDRARDLAQKALASAPHYARAQLLLARALEQLGDWPGSVQVLQRALDDSPHLPDVVRAAAQASQRLERPAEALERLRVAAVLRADSPGTRMALAGQLADLGEPDEAIQVLEKLVREHPFENGARLRLAELLAANGHLKRALKQFAQAKALSPDEAQVYAREGEVLLSADRKVQAIASFDKALALRPQNPALKEMLRELKGAGAVMGEQYALDVAPLSKQAEAYLGEDAVTLADVTYVRVQPTGLSSRFHQFAVKVNTDRGVEAFRSFPITYSPSRQEVSILRARITKPDGSIVESYGDNERTINEPWSQMYYDEHAKVISFPQLAKGDVLELEYRLEDTAADNLLSDYWGDVSYVQATSPKLRFVYLVDMPKGRKLYWDEKEVGPGIAETAKTEPDGRTLYQWAAHDVPKIDPEPGMPGWSEVAATLHVSTYQTWDQVARYYWGLVRDQLTPNQELVDTVNKLLANVDRKDTRAVVAAIYDFVVSNTRYVALEFGIHGYKPYRVDQILARRFGDCKDKASLITAMLKVAGVDADMVLLRMRDLGAIGGEPASLAPFNHAIAYVPSLDLFLDGTAEFHGATELPWVDHLADALIVDPSGKGHFLVTPDAKASDNVIALDLDVTLGQDGAAQVQGHTDVTGQQAPSYRRSYQAADTRNAMFEQGWAQTFPGLTVSSLKMSDAAALEQGVKLDYTMRVPRYAEVQGSGLRFYPFGSGRQLVQTYASLSERKHDLVMSGPWVNTVRVHYQVPKGMGPSDLPAEVKGESPFGHYRLGCSLKDGAITCDSEVSLTVDRVKAKDYPAFRAFLGRIDQAFARKITLTTLPTTASR